MKRGITTRDASCSRGFNSCIDISNLQALSYVERRSPHGTLGIGSMGNVSIESFFLGFNSGQVPRKHVDLTDITRGPVI